MALPLSSLFLFLFFFHELRLLLRIRQKRWIKQVSKCRGCYKFTTRVIFFPTGKINRASSDPTFARFFSLYLLGKFHGVSYLFQDLHVHAGRAKSASDINPLRIGIAKHFPKRNQPLYAFYPLEGFERKR